MNLLDVQANVKSILSDVVDNLKEKNCGLTQADVQLVTLLNEVVNHNPSKYDDLVELAKQDFFNHISPINWIWCGIHSGFSPCCIAYFSFYHRYADNQVFEHVMKYSKKNSQPGYILCPECILAERKITKPIISCKCMYRK